MIEVWLPRGLELRHFITTKTRGPIARHGTTVPWLWARSGKGQALTTAKSKIFLIRWAALLLLTLGAQPALAQRASQVPRVGIPIAMRGPFECVDGALIDAC
jgi:hypothetical protein